jgi:hypothetical protein
MLFLGLYPLYFSIGRRNLHHFSDMFEIYIQNGCQQTIYAPQAKKYGMISVNKKGEKSEKRCKKEKKKGTIIAKKIFETSWICVEKTEKYRLFIFLNCWCKRRRP